MREMEKVAKDGADDSQMTQGSQDKSLISHEAFSFVESRSVKLEV